MNRSSQQQTACIVHYDSESDNESARDALGLHNKRLFSDSETIYRHTLNGKDDLELNRFAAAQNPLSRSWNGKLTTQYPAISENQAVTASTKLRSQSTSDLNLMGNNKVRSMQRSRQQFMAPVIESSLSLPALRTGPGDTSLTTSAEYLEDPKWNRYLNAWVSSKLGKNYTYITFAGSVDIMDRDFYHYVPEFDDFPVLPCPRFLAHMHKPAMPKLPEVKTRKRMTEKPKFWVWKKKAEPIAVPKLPPKPPAFPQSFSHPTISTNTAPLFTPPHSPSIIISSSSDSDCSMRGSPSPLLLTDQSPSPLLLTDQSPSPLLLTDQSPSPLLQSPSPLLLTDQSPSPLLLTDHKNIPWLPLSSPPHVPHLSPLPQIATSPQEVEIIDQEQNADIDEKEDFSDYGSIKSGIESEVQSEVSKRTVVSLTSGHTPNNGVNAISDAKPTLELYYLSGPPMTPSSMDWETAQPLDGGGDSDDNDDVVFGISPSKLERLFFSNDYIEIFEVPTFGQTDNLNLDLYQGVQLFTEPEMSAGKLLNIQPPERLVVQGTDRITIHDPPDRPIPVPEVPRLPTPPPVKESVPEPAPLPPPKAKKDEPKPKKKVVPKKTKPKPEKIASSKKKPSKPKPATREKSSVIEVKPEKKEPPPKVPSPPPPKVPSPPPPKLNIPTPEVTPPPPVSRQISNGSLAPPTMESDSYQDSSEIDYEIETTEASDYSPDLAASYRDDNVQDTPPPPLSPPIEEPEIKPPTATDTSPRRLVQKRSSLLNLRPAAPKELTPEPPSVEPQPQDEDEIKDEEKKILPNAVKDPEFVAQQIREKLAEERMRKAVEMFERLKEKRYIPVKQLNKKMSFRTDGWLAQFCILKDDKMKRYQHAFNTVDEDGDGYLSFFETLLALKGVHGAKNLTEKEEAYIVRVLEIAGCPISQGSDLRMFSLLAALSQKIASIDSWVKNYIEDLNLGTLEWKMTCGKEMFDCCLDEERRSLHLEQFLVELKAGGVSEEHQEEVKLTLGANGSWDLLDFLSYLPLFIMTHKSVVCNPLDDTRDK